MSDFTETELRAMTPAERALADYAASYKDPDNTDRRFGNLPYDEVLDPDGKPLH